MEKMKKINKIKEIENFIIIFGITLIIFIPFLQKHYSTDSYYMSSIGLKEFAIKNSLNDGRVLIALIGYTADLLKIPFDIYIFTSTIIALFISCISVFILKKYIIQIKNNKNFMSEILALIVSYFTIFNFMYIENFVFVECSVMALSILLYILSAKTIVLHKKNYIAKTIILIILGLFCYQGTVSVFLSALLVFSFLENAKKSECIKNIVKGVLILLFGILVQLIVIKIVGKILNLKQERIGSFYDIIINIVHSIYYLKDIIIQTGNVYTKYLYLFFLSIIEMSIIYKVYKEKLNEEIIIHTLLIIVFCIFAGVSVSFMNLSGFWSARIRFSIGATIGFLIMYLYCKTDIAVTYKRINLMIIFAFIIYSLSIVTNYISIMNNTLMVNLQDKNKTIKVSNYVKKYEKENSLIVNKLAIFPGRFNDGAEKASYKNLKYRGSAMSWSAIRTQWSIKGIIEMYSNKHYIMKEPNEDELEYYLDNVDKEIDYMCIGDTLYIAYYVE